MIHTAIGMAFILLACFSLFWAWIQFWVLVNRVERIEKMLEEFLRDDEDGDIQ